MKRIISFFKRFGQDYLDDDSYLENVDLQERDKNGKPIYKPADVTNSLKSIGGIVESLNKVRQQVEREQTSKGTLRGQRQKGNREDPS